MYGLVLSAECSARRSARPGKQLPARSQSSTPTTQAQKGHRPNPDNHQHSKTIPVAAGRAGESARRGETNGAARRDRRGFGCRKRWNCSCSFSGDSECYGGWPQASYGIRIDRGLAVVLQSCRAGIFLGETRERVLALASFWRAAFGGCPLVYLIAATGVAQITNASPEIGCWGWTLGTVPDWDGPFFSIEFVGAASRQQWTPRCSQLSYLRRDLAGTVRYSGLGKAGCQFSVLVLVVSSSSTGGES